MFNMTVPEHRAKPKPKVKHVKPKPKPISSTSPRGATQEVQHDGA